MHRSFECPYYCLTSTGVRCVFLSPEEWRMRQHALRDYCTRGGSGCTVRMHVLMRASHGRFLNRVENGSSVE